MNEVSRMQVLYSLYHLVCKHKDCLQPESSTTQVKNLLERVPEKLHDHNIEVAVFLKVDAARYANCRSVYIVVKEVI